MAMDPDRLATLLKTHIVSLGTCMIFLRFEKSTREYNVRGVYRALLFRQPFSSISDLKLATPTPESIGKHLVIN